MSNIRNQLDHINQRIQQALQTSDRPANTPVRLLAVSKHHSLDKIQSLYELGQRDFGESYVQEALDKIHRNENKDIIWHFIGPIFFLYPSMCAITSIRSACRLTATRVNAGTPCS